MLVFVLLHLYFPVFVAILLSGGHYAAMCEPPTGNRTSSRGQFFPAKTKQKQETHRVNLRKSTKFFVAINSIFQFRVPQKKYIHPAKFIMEPKNEGLEEVFPLLNG